MAVLHYDYNFHKLEYMNKTVFSRQPYTTDDSFSNFEYMDKFESAKSRKLCPPTKDRKLPTEDRKLPTKNRKLPTENRKLPTENRKLLIEDRKLLTEDRKLPTEDRKLPTED